MDENFQTSQQKAGEHHLTEGQNSAGAPAVQYGSEGSAPGAVTEPIKGESIKMEAMETSQQKNDEHDKPEGE